MRVRGQCLEPHHVGPELNNAPDEFLVRVSLGPLIDNLDVEIKLRAEIAGQIQQAHRRRNQREAGPKQANVRQENPQLLHRFAGSQETGG